MREAKTLALCIFLLLLFSAVFSYSTSYLALTIFKSFKSNFLYISLWLFGIFVSSLLLFVVKSLVNFERINIEQSYFVKNFFLIFFILLVFSFLIYRVLLEKVLAHFVKESMEKLLYMTPDFPSMGVYSNLMALFNVLLDVLIVGYILGYSRKLFIILYFIFAPFLYFLLLMIIPSSFGVILKGISISVVLIIYYFYISK